MHVSFPSTLTTGTFSWIYIEYACNFFTTVYAATNLALLALRSPFLPITPDSEIPSQVIGWTGAGVVELT